jgi:hypothetical protein
MTEGAHTRPARAIARDSAPGVTRAVTFPTVVYAIGVVGAALMLVRAQNDPDAWWHLRVAAGIVESGHVPTSDAISWWSAGTSWISPSWLNELLLYVSNSIAGVAGQSLVYVPVYLAIVVLVERLIVMTAPWLSTPWRLVTLAVMSVGLIPVMEPRAGNFDLLFSLFGLYGWMRFRRDGSTLWLWLMPAAAVLWANLHGSGVMVYFALALAFGVGTLVDRRRFTHWRWRPFLISVALTYLALGLNPYGPALYVYPWSTLLSPAQTSTIAEWQTPDLSSVSLLGVRALLALGLVVGFARTRVTDAAGALAAAGMLFLSLGAIRYLIIAVPLLAIWFVPEIIRGARRYVRLQPRRWPAGRSSRYAELAAAAPIFMLGAAFSAGALPANQARLFAASYPSSSLEQLAQCRFARVWTDYSWGGWTSYQTGWLVGPYGAADALGDQRLSTAGAVEKLTTDPGLVFDELGVDAVVTQADRPLAFWLSANPAWHVIGSDEVSVAVVRATTQCAS